jgi:DNA-binding CsgD family transcriptional regulator
MLRGRESELAELGAAETRAQKGVAQVALVYGVAGIGRTAVLDTVATQLAASETTVIRASGDESETSLTFGVVDQILDGFGHDAIELGDPRAAGAVLLAAWIAAATTRELAVVIDDAQWADAPSLLAITFALRRLNNARAFTLIACTGAVREELPPGIQRLAAGGTGCTIVLGPLPHDALAQLLRDAGLPHLTRDQVDRVVAHTEGNPLHTHTLVRELDAAEFASDMRGPFRAPRSITALVQARVANLSVDGEALVVAAAVLGSKSTLDAVRALAGIAAPNAALAEACAADIIVVEPGPGDPLLRFTHATTRSAIYHGVAPDRIAALHRQAAELVDNDPAGALRHRILGAPVANEALAIEADGLADMLAHRGAWFEAAAWLNAAERVSSTARSRERRILTAELYRNYGGAGPSLPAGTEADLKTDHPLRALLTGGAAVKDSRFAEAELHLRAAWDLVDPSTEPDLAARIAIRLSDALQGQLRTDEALEWTRTAVAVLPAGRVLLGEDPITDLVFGLTVAGHRDEATAVLDERVPETGTIGPNPSGLLGRAIVKLWNDDLPGAFADFTACAERFRRVGPPHRCVEAEMMLIEVHYRNGRWDTAIRHADEAISLERELEIGQLLALVLAYAATVRAARGEWAVAETMLDEATEILLLRGAYGAMGYTWLGRARLAAARGEHQGVVDALSPVAALAPTMPQADEESIFPWRLIYATALVGLGRVDEAEQHAARLTSSAERRGNPSTVASAARLRAVVAGARGDVETASTELTGAATLFNEIPMPFEAAQADLDHGVILARAGRRIEGTAQLAKARAAFAHLGAAPFVVRCDAAIARAAGLSRAEAAVAELVVRGQSNRDVAEALHVSVRTVEDHLGHIYTKLGVSSRTQLAALLASESR